MMSLPEFETVTPEEAYACAPPMIKEIGWVAASARRFMDPAAAEVDEASRVRYFLRKAALLDRIAIQARDERVLTPEANARQAAESAARRYQKIVAPDVPAFPAQAREFVRAAYSNLSHEEMNAPVIPTNYAGQEPHTDA